MKPNTTNVKEQAYELYLKDLSYKQIGNQLNISKTRAFEYVKEVKMLRENRSRIPVPNGSELGSDKRSERNMSFRSELKKRLKAPVENLVPPPLDNKSKEFTGDDLLKEKFEQLHFTGKFLDLIGKPEKKFAGIIWGLPKGGKSNFAIRFADYLHEYFGHVVYIAAEEGAGVTLQSKFKDIGGSSITVYPEKNRDKIRTYLISKECEFVFIDSINHADIDNDFLELLKSENPTKSFVAIVQATKSGNFKGDQSLTHNCDFIIKVVAGTAYHEGRFGPVSEVKIFEEPLYEKNKEKKVIPENKNNVTKETKKEHRGLNKSELFKGLLDDKRPFSKTEIFKDIL